MAAFADVQNKPRPPLRIVVLPPTAFADDWREKPDADVAVGLSLLSESDIETARAEAARRAWSDHPEERDLENRVDAFNDRLMTILVGRSLCDPNNAARPWDHLQGLAEEGARERLTPAGIKKVYDELEAMMIGTSPTRAPIEDDQMFDIVDSFLERIGKIPTDRAERVRRLLGFVAEELAAQ